MKFEQVAIETIAYDTPPEVLSSDEIEDFLYETYYRLRLPKGRLELMTGIQERKFYPSETLPSTISAKAGRAAMQKAVLSVTSLILLSMQPFVGIGWSRRPHPTFMVS